MNRDRFAYIFSGVVMVAWMVVLGAGLLTKDYTALTILTPVLLMVAGFLFGYGPKDG
jgi:uncharacterized membrane protein YedE/YeeE